MATKKLTTKIFVFAVALLFAIAPVFCIRAAKAGATDLATSDFFNNAESYLDGTDLCVKTESGKTSYFQRKLVVNDFGMQFTVPDTIKTLEISLSYDPYYLNGEYENDTVETAVVLDFTANTFYWSNKDDTTASVTFDKTSAITLELSVTNNLYTVEITNNGSTVSLAQPESAYKVAVSDKAVARIAVKPTSTDDSDVTIKYSYIDQDTTEVSGKYKQQFTLNGEQTAIATFATPYILTDENFAVKNGNVFQRYFDMRYQISFTCYYIASDSYVSTSNIKVQEQTGLTMFQSGSTSYVIISSDFGTGTADERTGDIDIIKKTDSTTETLRTITVRAVNPSNVDVDSDDDEDTGNDAAPVYNHDAVALANYKSKLENSLTKEYEIDGTMQTRSIRVGSGEYLELPTMEDMVSDEFCSYHNMTFTVKYFTPTNSTGSSASMRIPINQAGRYRYFVMFKDNNGNEMWEKDFLEYDSNGNVIGLASRYAAYVFEFELKDDAPVSVTAGTQEKAYKGVQYAATAFTIDASEYNVEYSLYYSADNVTWGEAITKASDLKEPDKADYVSGCAGSAEYNQAKKWYDYCKAINYDGSLTFTPDEIGYYKIECKVATSLTSVTESVTINVTGEPEVVTPDTHWFINNIWSILFLVIGTLALVGIILLLVIKPKDKNTVPEKKKKD